MTTECFSQKPVSLETALAGGHRVGNPSCPAGREASQPGKQLRLCWGTPSTINIPSAKLREPDEILLPFYYQEREITHVQSYFISAQPTPHRLLRSKGSLKKKKKTTLEIL